MNNFVVTPLNFIKYNAVVDNLEQHGLHPRFLHFLINVPLLFNVLGITGLVLFVKMMYRYSLFYNKYLDVKNLLKIFLRLGHFLILEL